MPYLKCTACHAHGYGTPEYIRLNEGETLESTEETQLEWHQLHGDPEGFRSSKFEIVEFPPIESLYEESKRVASEIESLRYYKMKLWEDICKYHERNQSK